MRMQLPTLRLAAICASWLWLTIPTAQALADLSAPSGTPPSITLDEALKQAAYNRPEILGFAADLETAQVQLSWATAPPNPEFGLEVENLGSSRPDGDVTETTVSLSQPFELGGKAEARKNTILMANTKLQHEQITTWLDIAAEVRKAFIEVLGARESLSLLQEAETISTELARITRERVTAGELAATEETRAKARQAEAQVETQQAKRQLAETELNLAAVLVSPAPLTAPAGDRLPQSLPVPELAMLLDELQKSPFLELRRNESKLAASNLSLQQSNAWSDPSISIALREVPDKDARSLTIGLSIPLPLFQRNQTGIAEAGATLKKSAANERLSAFRLRTELTQAHMTLSAATLEANTLHEEVLVRAEEASAAVQEGYRLGKFRYSDVLEASQALLAAKNKHLEAMLTLNRAAITLDRLLGRSPQLTKILNSPSNSVTGANHE